MKFRIILAIVLLISLSGCGPKTIDSSTDETLQASMEDVSNSLSGDKKEDFKTALKEITLAEAFSQGNSDAFRSRLNGKTADQVIADGNQLIAERKKKEKEQALKEIEEVKKEISQIEKKRSDAATAKEALKKIQVTRSRFFVRDDIISRPAIELTMKNNTPHAIATVYFNAVLASPGRSVPWVEDSFSYDIPGGLEPNEELTEELAPNMYGEWRNAPEDRKDMILTLTIVRIDGADKEPIYQSEFPESEDKRQKDLADRVSQLEKAL